MGKYESNVILIEQLKLKKYEDGVNERANSNDAQIQKLHKAIREGKESLVKQILESDMVDVYDKDEMVYKMYTYCYGKIICIIHSMAIQHYMLLEVSIWLSYY